MDFGGAVAKHFELCFELPDHSDLKQEAKPTLVVFP
jgi:hypothetical protein